jgi:hypothetical protein|tara:strand:+ start:386 stop:727 length:342 start_codon:yes stop_codon:yes gene_type:complete
MDEQLENWQHLMRELSNLVGKNEESLWNAEADLKKLIATKMFLAEMEHGCKSAVAQQRFADMDDDVHQLRLQLGVCRAKKEALKLKAKSIEIGFDKWRTDQVSLRTERKNYGA